MLQIYSTTLMIGILIGPILFGYISDKYGRSVALLSSITILSLSSLVGVFMPTVAVYGFFRFLAGSYLSCINKSLFAMRKLTLTSYTWARTKT